MRAKAVTVILLMCLIVNIIGCQSMKEIVSTSVKSEEEIAQEYPVIGDRNIRDYEGFIYLTDETLFDETEEERNKRLTVYIPENEDNTVTDRCVYGYMYGIDYFVELDPTEEDVAYYEEEIEEFEEDEAYMKATARLLELDNDLTVFVSFFVYGDEMTNKTARLLGELESFYQFEIETPEILKSQEASSGEEEYHSKRRSLGVPRLGQENIQDYEGFTYLHSEVLVSESGGQETKQLVVFMPTDEDNLGVVIDDYALCQAYGVLLQIRINPYFSYETQEYSLEKKLDAYVEEYFDIAVGNMWDVVIGEGELISENSAVVTVEYCEYSSWNSSFESVFQTFYLLQLDEENCVMVTVVVSEDEVTKETEALIEELQQFYGFSVDWDADRAREKREANEESGKNIHSTGYIVFELPSGWEETESDSYNEMIYAPYGDSDFAQCMICFYRCPHGYDSASPIEEMVVSENVARIYIESMLGMEINECSLEFCDTVLGEAAKISYSVTNNSDNYIGEVYLILDDYYFYSIEAFQSEFAMDDAVAALRYIMANGQTRTW